MSKKSKSAEAKAQAVTNKTLRPILTFLGALVDRMDRIEARIESLGRWTDAPTPEAEQEEDQPKGLDPDRRWGGNWAFLTITQAARVAQLVKDGPTLKEARFKPRRAKVLQTLDEAVDYQQQPVLTRRDTAFLGWVFMQSAVQSKTKPSGVAGLLNRVCTTYLEEANARAAEDGCGPVEPGTLHEVGAF